MTSESDQVVWYGDESSFFGAAFHVYESCSEVKAGTLLEVWLPDAMFPLPAAWCCCKCGDMLSMTAEEL